MGGHHIILNQDEIDYLRRGLEILAGRESWSTVGVGVPETVYQKLMHPERFSCNACERGDADREWCWLDNDHMPHIRTCMDSRRRG